MTADTESTRAQTRPRGPCALGPRRVYLKDGTLVSTWKGVNALHHFERLRDKHTDENTFDYAECSFLINTKLIRREGDFLNLVETYSHVEQQWKTMLCPLLGTGEGVCAHPFWEHCPAQSGKREKALRLGAQKLRVSAHRRRICR